MLAVKVVVEYRGDELFCDFTYVAVLPTFVEFPVNVFGDFVFEEGLW